MWEEYSILYLPVSSEVMSCAVFPVIVFQHDIAVSLGVYKAI